MGPSRFRARLLALAATGAALGGGVAETAAAAPLGARLARALQTPGVAWASTGVVALDLRTGGVVYGRNAGVSLRPASNEKLPVALAALDELGPSFRFETRVFGEGRLDGAVWRGRLVLKGYGDPTLSHADLTALAQELEDLGIRRVTGGVLADETYFDARRTAPGWRPSYYKVHCPPLSALVVARAKVDGRTVDDPALWAARALRAALVAEGIRVARGAATGRVAPGAKELADVRSGPLTGIVGVMNRESDNFYAEMLVKTLGAAERGAGSTRAGAAVVRRELRQRGVPLAGVRIADGSGLSLLDRLTARALVALLVSAHEDERISTPFFRSLAIAGVNGTLEDRMGRRPAFARVRAKTGTTRLASALSGYVARRYAFAILQNGNPIPHWHARSAQDRFAQVLAGA